MRSWLACRKKPEARFDPLTRRAFLLRQRDGSVGDKIDTILVGAFQCSGSLVCGTCKAAVHRSHIRLVACSVVNHATLGPNPMSPPRRGDGPLVTFPAGGHRCVYWESALIGPGR